MSATNNVETMEADTLNNSLNKYQRRTRQSTNNSANSNERDLDKNNSGKK